MTTEPGPAGQGNAQASPDAPFDLSVVLGHPKVQEHMLDLVRRATAEADERWKPQLDTLQKESDRRATEWGEERRKLKATATASELSDDAVKLRDRLMETETIKAQGEARIGEANQRLQQVAVREALLQLKEQYPKLPKTFWDGATERLSKGTASGITISIEAQIMAGVTGEPKPEAKEPTGPALSGMRQGRGGTSLDDYRKALRDGKPLPSGAEIDGMTARFLSGQ